MARFRLTPGLDQRVAWMVAPEVHRVAKQFERAAKRAAPAGKKWVSMEDNNVRDAHRGAHAHPMIPSNTRFQVEGQLWDIAHGLSPGVDHLLHPKDTSTGLPYNPAGDGQGFGEHTGSAVQHVNCRCVAALHPTAVAEQVKTTPYTVTGAVVRVQVYCTFVKIVESEFGDTYPTRFGMQTDEGSRWMGRAAAKFAATR